MKNKVAIVECIPSLIIIVLIILAIIGEVKCIIKAIDSDWDPISKREIIYAGAFVTGIGSVIGWFDFEDSKPNVIPANAEPQQKDSIVIVTDTIYYSRAIIDYNKKQNSLKGN